MFTRRFVIAALSVCLIAAFCWVCLYGALHSALHTGSTQVRAAGVEGAAPSLLVRSLRPRYPYSVVPGGAYTPDELRAAAKRDAVVRAHYQDFHLDRAAVVINDRDRMLYVSYRKGENVHWTHRALRIPKGESLLSDGEHLARVRCGNRLSPVPVSPAPSADADMLPGDVLPKDADLAMPDNTDEEVRKGALPLADVVADAPLPSRGEQTTAGISLPASLGGGLPGDGAMGSGGVGGAVPGQSRNARAAGSDPRMAASFGHSGDLAIAAAGTSGVALTQSSNALPVPRSTDHMTAKPGSLATRGDRNGINSAVPEPGSAGLAVLIVLTLAAGQAVRANGAKPSRLPKSELDLPA